MLLSKIYQNKIQLKNFALSIKMKLISTRDKIIVMIVLGYSFGLDLFLICSCRLRRADTSSIIKYQQSVTVTTTTNIFFQNISPTTYFTIKNDKRIFKIFLTPGQKYINFECTLDVLKLLIWFLASIWSFHNMAHHYDPVILNWQLTTPKIERV